MARPTKYRSEYPNMAAGLRVEGYTIARLAEVFRVAPSTICKWKTEHSGFSKAIELGESAGLDSVTGSVFGESKVGGSSYAPELREEGETGSAQDERRLDELEAEANLELRRLLGSDRPSRAITDD